MRSVVFEIFGSHFPGFPFEFGVQMIAYELVMICRDSDRLDSPRVQRLGWKVEVY